MNVLIRLLSSRGRDTLSTPQVSAVKRLIGNRVVRSGARAFRVLTWQPSRRGTVSENAFATRAKSYARLLDHSKVPKLEEADLEEQFVRGSGPGGQAVNKTSNAVVLKHKPTGITVKCHESRSVLENRKRAREHLIRKLDNHLNGADSLESQEKLLRKKDLEKKQQKKKKLAEMKKAFKEREGLE